MRGAEACGTENNSSAAWVKVEENEVITFYNFQGDKSSCKLDNGLKHGSRCTALDLGSSAKSPSTMSPSNMPPSTEPSSSLTTQKSSPSVSESPSTTFQIAPASDCSAA
jgi:hypothetical protein